MPLVDVMDSTWIRARPAAVGAIVADPGVWPRWWPGLDLVATELRDDKGVRWDVASVADAPGLTGTAELWLQVQGDGVVAHFFLRLDAPDPEPGDGAAADHGVARLELRYRRLTKQALWALADQLDPGRLDRHTSATHARLT